METYISILNTGKAEQADIYSSNVEAEESEQELLLDNQSMKSSDSIVGKMFKYVWSFFQPEDEEQDDRVDREDMPEVKDASISVKISKYVWSFIPKSGEEESRSLKKFPTDFMAAAAELNCKITGVDKVVFSRHPSFRE